MPKSLNELKKPKYQAYFRGIDISDDSFDNSQYDSLDDFYDKEVKGEVDCLCRGSVVIFDDPMDTPIKKRVLGKIN